MLFNSYEFIFIFLPLTLAGFFLLGARDRTWAIRWLILASLLFYAWWRPVNVLIIAPSIVINFFLARTLLRLRDGTRPGLARAVLIAGIAFNVLFLGYFKYANFAVGAVNDVMGTDLVLAQIILPLGISFITFQKIAFLVDVHAQRIQEFTLQDYALFVLFFPQLVAGPIVHYREMMPQFQRSSCRFDRENAAVGLTLFVMGLTKKVFFADGIAAIVSPIYARAAEGGPISLLPAWMAALGFTLQIYFDFSGYTDMALGLGRFVGVRFPPNFNSPLKATSIIEFWQRWHMSLTRFLTAYIYNPLALWLTRRRLARKLPPLTRARPSAGAFLSLVMFPTLVTMFISGLWHGAGYLFIIWGVLHGVYLTINHAWRLWSPRIWPDQEQRTRVMRPVGFLLTFVSVVAAMVIFRAPTTGAAADLLRGLVGLNGIGLPTSILDHLGPLSAILRRLGVEAGLGAGLYLDFGDMVIWAGGLLLIALTLPNTLQLLARYEPALEFSPDQHGLRIGRFTLAWRPTLTWAVLVSVVAAVGMLHLGGQSEFLYWQF